MSTLNPTQVAPAPERPTTVPAIPFPRLIATELRKTVDTRAGRWLFATMVLITLAVVAVVYANVDPAELTFRRFVVATSSPQALFVPLLGILAITSEWQQRTGLVTFALEPRRMRVVAAKAVAVLVLGAAMLVVSMAMAAAGNALAAAIRDANGSWQFGITGLASLALLEAIWVIQGLAFGLAVLNTPVAVVTYLVLPTLWTFVGELVSRARDAGKWLDLNVTTTPLYEGGMTPQLWLRLGTSLALWVALPLAVGLWRVRSKDIR